MRSLRQRTRKCVRRSRLRYDGILAFRKRGRMTIRELARELGVSARRARGVLYGDMPDFAPRHSLVHAGIVMAVVSPIGDEHELTEAGVVEASVLETAKSANRRL